MKFTKMHGAGNDFIIIDDRDSDFSPSEKSIASLCHRNLGIGADGLILIRPSTRGDDFRMIYYNSDGSRAEMCGNGARCAARLAYQKSIAPGRMKMETDSGTIIAEADGKLVDIQIGKVTGLRLGVQLEGSELKPALAVCGVPHAALFVQDVETISRDRFLETCRSVRNDKVLSPEGANVNLVKVVDKNNLFYRTYERGVENETLACGTGAVAVAVIAAHLGKTEPPVSCYTRGGDRLKIEFVPTPSGADNCHLAGPAVITFTGEFAAGDYSEAGPPGPAVKR